MNHIYLIKNHNSKNMVHQCKNCGLIKISSEGKDRYEKGKQKLYTEPNCSGK